MQTITFWTMLIKFWRIPNRRNSKRCSKNSQPSWPIPSAIKLSRNTNLISTIPCTVGSHAFSRVCAPCWRLPEYLWSLIERGACSRFLRIYRRWRSSCRRRTDCESERFWRSLVNTGDKSGQYSKITRVTRHEMNRSLVNQVAVIQDKKQ